MSYKIEETRTVEIILEVVPCKVCASTDVKLWDCGYSSFNVCGIDCKNCDNKFKFNGDFTEKELIQKWNYYNNSKTKEEKIAILREQLKHNKITPLV